MGLDHTPQTVNDDEPEQEAGVAMPVIKESKHGIKTTEFWLAFGLVVLTQLQVVNFPGKYGELIATIVPIGIYILSRGVAKAGVPAVAVDSE